MAHSSNDRENKKTSEIKQTFWQVQYQIFQHTYN